MSQAVARTPLFSPRSKTVGTRVADFPGKLERYCRCHHNFLRSVITLCRCRFHMRLVAHLLVGGKVNGLKFCPNLDQRKRQCRGPPSLGSERLGTRLRNLSVLNSPNPRDNLCLYAGRNRGRYRRCANRGAVDL